MNLPQGGFGHCNDGIVRWQVPDTGPEASSSAWVAYVGPLPFLYAPGGNTQGMPSGRMMSA